ncbi:carboxymuconolactone decarboxylase family protein [Massilia niastensis]|uniref:carboxymuconolactone decarboxylase family protein n=1 Tax=Massilia niastensis TaxID=544911 RepID=UPI000365FE6F|nr:carboxymuconolactone decarboxylase family protein [Massilia niastensis]
MNQRIDYYKASKEATGAMLALEKAVNAFGLEPSLLELVKLRASQINGCAFCVDLHTADAKKAGESDRRLHAVTVWREAPFFTPRERAALAWTESLTRLPDTHASDADYALLREHFSDKEMADLTVAIIAINGWNRLAVGFRKTPQV